MVWKTRNGREYYYESVREGGKVRSRYYGNGELARLVSQLDELERRRRAEAKEEREAWAGIEDALDDQAADANRAAAEALAAAGYHQHHRGEWRKRRGRG